MPGMSDLGPGWIAFGPIGGAAGGLVAAGQILTAPWKHQLTWRRWWKVRHAGVITKAADERFRMDGGRVGGPTLVEAEPGGVRTGQIGAEHWNPDWIYVLPQYEPDQAAEVAAIADRQAAKKIPYAFECYPAIALHRSPLPTPALDRWLSRTDDDGDPARVICSWEVDTALTLSGGLDGKGHVFNDGRAAHDVVPSELYLRLLELGPAEVIQPNTLRYVPSRSVIASYVPRPIPHYLL